MKNTIKVSYDNGTVNGEYEVWEHEDWPQHYLIGNTTDTLAKKYCKIITSPLMKPTLITPEEAEKAATEIIKDEFTDWDGSRVIVLKSDLVDAISESANDKYNSEIIPVLEAIESELKKSKETIQWMVDNCRPDENCSYSDFFNITHNQMNQIESTLSQLNELLNP